MKHFSLTQRGDTIVEVLITISIISLVLVGAYATTNKSTASTQDAQERTHAVKLVESQIENLRNTVTQGTALRADTFCYVDSTATPNSGQHPPNNPCVVNANDDQASRSDEPAYDIAISDCSTGTCIIQVSWDAISGGGTENVTMYYRPPTP